MKTIIILGILYNIAFSIGVCPGNQKVCLYLYKGPMHREIRIVNYKNETIIFNASGWLSLENFKVKNVKLEAYQTYTTIQKFYLYPKDIHEDYKVTFFNYKIDNKKQNINIYKNKIKIKGRQKHRIKITKKIFERTIIRNYRKEEKNNKIYYRKKPKINITWKETKTKQF